MKPRNFPGRKAIRIARAQCRAARSAAYLTTPRPMRLIDAEHPMPEPHPSVRDTRFRCGAANRDASGIGRIMMGGAE